MNMEEYEKRLPPFAEIATDGNVWSKEQSFKKVIAMYITKKISFIKKLFKPKEAA